jgi:hypothetical protein
MGGKRTGADPANVRRALGALEKAGVIERVERLPLLGFKECGAWTWRLVVEPDKCCSSPVVGTGTTLSLRGAPA